MTPQDFQFVSALLKQRSGLILTEDKHYLLKTRLAPIVRQHGLKDIDELIRAMRGGDRRLIADVTDAMTTNETFFFRDIKPFQVFREWVLPRLLRDRKDRKSFRIWCAAASTGQEPYTLSMILQEEAANLASWRYEIVATDISDAALAKAKAGVYSQFEVQRGLPTPMLIKYFEKSGDHWQTKPQLRSSVKYQKFNLLDDLRPLGQFDVVFCRNVLIYFDQETKSQTLDRICQRMPSDGVLFLGGAETVVGVTNCFAPVAGQRGVYCPAPSDDLSSVARPVLAARTATVVA